MRLNAGDALLGLGGWTVGLALFGMLRLFKINHSWTVEDLAGLGVGLIIQAFIVWMIVCVVFRMAGVWPVWPFTQ